MNIDTLFMFSHIVETGSMTRAAQHLHISQSALTQQVKTLENQLGARLLERSNRGVVPTAAGEVVYRAALDIHELRRKMEQELESLRTDARILRIAATHLVYTYALPCTLFDLKRKFSSIRLETEALSSGQIEDKVTDSMTGTRHYHFWGANANTVEFTLEQEVKDLKSGKYNYAISIMGGDGGETEIYAYVKINGQIAARADTQITVYNEWHTAAIEGIEYSEGDSIVVGIYVKCAGPNAWGKIDDAMLNSVKE